MVVCTDYPILTCAVTKAKPSTNYKYKYKSQCGFAYFSLSSSIPALYTVQEYSRRYTMIYFLGSYLWNLLNLFLFIFYLRENLRFRFVYIFVRHYMNPDGLWIWSWHRPIRIQASWDSRFSLALSASHRHRDAMTNVPNTPNQKSSSVNTR